MRCTQGRSLGIILNPNLLLLHLGLGSGLKSVCACAGHVYMRQKPVWPMCSIPGAQVAAWLATPGEGVG
jgi:hypothetical protein